MVRSLAMLTMVKKKDTVVLQVDVPESFRTRFKIEALRRGITMGELLMQIFEEMFGDTLENKE
jgi:hypothetical protein